MPAKKEGTQPTTPDALIRRIRAVIERAGWRLSHFEIDGEQIRLHVDTQKEDTNE